MYICLGLFHHTDQAFSSVKSAQFYVGCAQIRVLGNGTGKLEPTVKIPGLYNNTTPGVLIPDFWTKITNYTEPGPSLWPEGTQTQHLVKQLG